MINPSILIFCAEKRELLPLIKQANKINSRLYSLSLSTKLIYIYITGVGKHAVKLSLSNLKKENIVPSRIINIGNAGGLNHLKKGTIIPIGKAVGKNGKDILTINNELVFKNVTVNSLQNKDNLLQQYPLATTVDMELFHLAKILPNIEAYKIILDTKMNFIQKFIFNILKPLFIKQNANKLCNLLKEIAT